MGDIQIHDGASLILVLEIVIEGASLIRQRFVSILVFLVQQPIHT